MRDLPVFSVALALRFRGLTVLWEEVQVFKDCSDEGVINPHTCEYFRRWMDNSSL